MQENKCGGEGRSVANQLHFVQCVRSPRSEPGNHK